jgi:WD40 repeat protein
VRRWWIGAGGLFVVTQMALAAPPAATSPVPDSTVPTAPPTPAASPFTLLEGQEVARTLPLRDFAQQVFGYNHDGGRILAADAEGPVLLDVRGQPRTRLECPQDEGSAAVDVSHGRDGTVVAALFASGRACVWDTANGALLSSKSRDIAAMAVGDRDSLVYGYADGKLEGRNARTGARRWQRNPDLGPIVHLRFQARGPLVAASTGANGVAVVDTRSGRLVRGLRGAPAWAAAFDPTSDRMAVGRANGRVELWNTKQWFSRDTVRFTGGQVVDVDFSPDGTQLAAATVTGEGAARVVTLEVWDFPIGELVFREVVPAGPGPTRTRFDTSGDRLLAGNGPGASSLVAGNGPGASRLWSRPGARQIPRALPNDEPPHHRPLPEAQILAALTTVPAERTLAGALAMAPDGRQVLVRASATPVPPTPTAPILSLVDLATGEARPLPGSTDAVGPFVYAAEGGRVGAVVGGAMHLWDSGTATLLGRVSLAGPTAASLLGERIALTTADGKVYVGTLERMRVVPGVTGATAVALDPLHADRVAVGTGDGGVRILDVRKGVAVGQWGIHAGAIGALAFSADGRFLATAGPRAGGDSAAVTVLAALPDDETDPWAAVVDTLPTRLAFSADGDSVVAVSARGVTVVRREVGTVVALSTPAVDAAFSTLSATSGSGLRWVDTLGAVRPVTIGAAALPSVPRGKPFATSADGRFSVTADGDRISVWNDRSGLLLRDLPAAGQAAVRCVFADDGDTIAVLYADRSIEIYEIETGEVLRNLEGPPVETGDWARFSDDGALLWTLAGPREIVGWDIATGTARERLVVPGEGPLRADDSRALARFVRISDATTEAWLDTAATPSLRLSYTSNGFRPVAVHPAGKIVAAVQEGGIARLDVDTSRRVGPLLRVEGQEPGRAAAFSADGAWLAVAYPTGLVRIWDLQRNAVVASLGVDARQVGRGAPQPVASLAFDAVGELVLARDPTGYPRLFEWRLSMEAPQAGLGAGPVLPSAEVTALAVSPNGRTLFSAHGDANARAWDVATGAQTAFYWGHAAAITSLGVAAGGNRLVTGSEDGSVRAWEVSSALEKVAVNTFADPVRTLAVSADGWRLAALGDGGVLRTWDGAKGRALRRWALPASPGGLPELDLGPAGERLGVAFPDNVGTAWLLDPATGAVAPSRSSPLSREAPLVGDPSAIATVRALAASLSPITAEVVTPDGATLVTAGADGHIRLWDVPTASLRGTLTALLDGSWVIDRPDGTRFGSESLRDGTAPLLYRPPPQ